MSDEHPRPQTWDEDSKDIVGSVANWMLVESIMANHSWTSLGPGDGLVLRGMEVVQAVAAYRGIHAGHVTVTPMDLLAAMKDLAGSSNAPAAAMPMWAPPEPPAADPAQHPAPEPPQAA